MTVAIDYQQLATALLQQQGGAQYKAAATPPTGVYAHGPGGLFSYPGVSRPLFSAMPLPRMGLQSMLPVRPSRDTNPLYGILTGQTATTGDEPDSVCDDPPTSGLLKLCLQQLPFGRQTRQTRSYDIMTAGEMTNRGEFSDYIIYGNPAGMETTGNVPSIPGADFGRAAQSDFITAMTELAVAWMRDFAREIYTGNPGDNTGGREYFNGLDRLINNSRIDAVTETACSAANSLIWPFNSADVAENSDLIVRTITSMWRALNYQASRNGLLPVRWAITMPFGLFYALTDIWPCSFMTFRCLANTTNTNASVDVDPMEAEQMRSNMRGDLYNRNNQYLLIDGQQVPVIIDDALEPSDGTNVSDIYFVPMTVMNSVPVTYMEYFDFNSPGGARDMANSMTAARSFYTTDNGRFLFGNKPPSNFCVQTVAGARPRLVLLTPQIAGRLTDVGWSELITPAPWDPSAPSFVNGGQTGYNWPSDFYGPSS
jgi:hypothetical protein